MARPKSLKKFDEGQLRRDLVAVFGKHSDQVAQLDKILHAMWAGENALTLVETIGAEFYTDVRSTIVQVGDRAEWRPNTRIENGVVEQQFIIDGYAWVPTAVLTELDLL